MYRDILAEFMCISWVFLLTTHQRQQYTIHCIHNNIQYTMYDVRYTIYCVHVLCVYLLTPSVSLFIFQHCQRVPCLLSPFQMWLLLLGGTPVYLVLSTISGLSRLVHTINISIYHKDYTIKSNHKSMVVCCYNHNYGFNGVKSSN